MYILFCFCCSLWTRPIHFVFKKKIPSPKLSSIASIPLAHHISAFPTPSSSYHTQSSYSSQLNLPAARSSYGQRVFSFAGASVWRLLPATAQQIMDFRFFSAKFEDLLIWLTLLACAWLNPALYYFACLHDHNLIFIYCTNDLTTAEPIDSHLKFISSVSLLCTLFFSF